MKKEKREQRKKLTAEIYALRTQLHQLRKEQQKQDNQIHKAMTKEQGEALQIWCIKTIAKHNLDYFRGSVLVEVVEYISVGGSHRVMRAIKICQGAKRLNFGVYPNIFDFLLEDLRQIAKNVPLSNEEMTAITCILYGKWAEASKAIIKLKRNEQN